LPPRRFIDRPAEGARQELREQAIRVGERVSAVDGPCSVDRIRPILPRAHVLPRRATLRRAHSRMLGRFELD
jgi:hypothetical protein